MTMRRWMPAAVYTITRDGAVSLRSEIDRVALVYDPADPWAVRIELAGDWLPSWVFARDLLTDGLRRGTAGDGDVRIAPAAAGRRGRVDRVRFDAACDLGRCQVYVLRHDVVDALASMHQVVPPGTEDTWVRWDRELRQLGVA